MAERIQKIMAQAGIASRRASEKLILEGKVKVNGKLINELGIKVEVNDHIEVNGTPIEQKEKLVYFLLNKPRGVITTNNDDKGRQTVVDIINENERVYPVGRLDYDTTGVLLLTNDGDLANTLMHPSYKIDKVYIAKIKGIPNNDDLKHLRLGIEIKTKKNGKFIKYKCAPAKTDIIESDKKKNISKVKITIHEGKYHQVKEMLKSIGCDVIKLHRERYGLLENTGLLPGEYRKLKYEEVEMLKSGKQYRKSSGRL